MIASLSNLLQNANQEKKALPCFNVFNLDFLQSIVVAAEEEDSPIIISISQDMVAYYSLEILVPLLLAFAKNTSVLVCPHLDHTYDISIVKQALELGLPSVMYDGSQLSLEENIAAMNEAGELTQQYRADLEGEVGSVSYADNDPQKKHIRSENTRPEDAVRMEKESSITALAVSVGNIHRLTKDKANIDFELLEEISNKVSLPLVIHGASGISPSIIKDIARKTSVAKFNIATDLRKSWGEALRKNFSQDSNLFDPLSCSRRISPVIKGRAKYWIDLLR